MSADSGTRVIGTIADMNMFPRQMFLVALLAEVTTYPLLTHPIFVGCAPGCLRIAGAS